MYPYCDFCREDGGDTCDLNYFQPFKISNALYEDLRKKLLSGDDSTINVLRRKGQLTLYPTRFALCTGCFKQFHKYHVNRYFLIPDTLLIETVVVVLDTNDENYSDSDSDFAIVPSTS